MKLAATLALSLALLPGCMPPPSRAPREAKPRKDLIPVSRAMADVDAAELKGSTVSQRQRWSAEAAAHPKAVVARYLAVYAQGSGQDAWAAMRALASEYPDAALPWIGLEAIYLKWGTLDQVDRTAAAAIDQEPDNWIAVLVRARADDRRERWDAAALGYRAVLAIDPENPDAHAGMAAVLRHAGDAAGARAEAAAALQGAPGNFRALVLSAELAAEAGDLQKAAEHWAAAADASPRDRAVRIQLAKIYTEKKDAGGALEAWQAAVSIKEDAESLVALAEAARAAHDEKAEGRALERLTQIDPSAAEWRRIAEIRLAAGDMAGAEGALRRALARDPKDAGANLQLGRIQASRGQPQEAIESLRAAGDPGREDLAALQARLNVQRVSSGDAGAIQKTVGALIEKTYRARLAELSALSGAIKLRTTVDAAGAATIVEVLEDSVHDPDVRACAYWNLHDAAYPPNKPGRYSFSFRLRPPR
ncbi:MAG TPA: tetratricopeptide repeat protein [Anaeromyxobacteraceae bacterium]|nr:tetratricopeptide repeat protein [Anaeromyxobacteraceae bacterium]